MVTKVEGSANGINVAACTYLGTRGFCEAICGPDSILFPTDSPARVCAPNPVPLYSTFADLCDEQVILTQDNLNCNAAHACMSAGRVSLAFGILAVLFTLFTLTAVVMRVVNREDKSFARKYAIIFSSLSLISCVVSYAAFRPCAQEFTNGIQYDLDNNALPGLINLTVTSKPGAGGIMLIIAVVIQLYMAIINYCLPSSEEGVGQGDQMGAKLIVNE